MQTWVSASLCCCALAATVVVFRHRRGNNTRNAGRRFGTLHERLYYSRKREKRHWQSMKGGVPVIVTEHVDEYRKAIALCVRKDEVVLEVGCHQGVTTERIGRHCARVVGVDKSSGTVAKAKARHPGIEFHNIDAFDVAALVKLGIKFDKVFVDISGNADVARLSELVDRYEKALKPAAIIVKGFKLVRFLNHCCTPDEYASELYKAGYLGEVEMQSSKLSKAEILASSTPKPTPTPPTPTPTPPTSTPTPPTSTPTPPSSTPTPPTLLEQLQPSDFAPLHVHSRSLTLWAACCSALTNLPGRTHLLIHCVGVDPMEGATPNSLCATFDKFFELCCLHSTIRQVEILMIGPHVPLRDGVVHNESRDSGMNVTMTFSQQLYHESMFQCEPADIAVLFNAGVWGYDSWLPTIDALRMKRCPTIVTSYNEYEADDDYEAIKDHVEERPQNPVEWMWEPESNPFSSDRSRESGIQGRRCTENNYWQCFKGKAPVVDF